MRLWTENAPLHRQVRDALVGRVLDGELSEGQSPPSVRQSASDLALNPHTVARAYQELADLGVLERRRGQGMVVASGARERLRTLERDHFLQEEWPRLQDRLRRLGLNPAHLP